MKILFIILIFILSISSSFSQGDSVAIKARCSLSNDSLRIKISISNGLKEKIFFPVSAWHFIAVDTIPIKASGSLIGVNEIYIFPSHFNVEVDADTILEASFGDSIPYFRCIDDGTICELAFIFNAVNCLDSKSYSGKNIFMNLTFSKEKDFLDMIKNNHLKKRDLLIMKNSFNIMDSPGLIKDKNLCWEFKRFKKTKYYVGNRNLEFFKYFNLRKEIIINFESKK